MGYSLTWVGIRGISYEDAIARLELRRTGENAEYAASPICARSLPEGWTLVVARRCEHRIIKPRALAKLSVNGEAIACSIEEHVMFSSCELWANGAKQWRVEHDAQRSIDDLSASGTLPEDFASTKANFAEQQAAEGGKAADVDLYFELPLTLAKSRVGFKHDELTGVMDDEQFEVLLVSSAPQQATSSRPWWKFWR